VARLVRVLLVLVVAILVLLGVADRVAAHYAQGAAGDFLASHAAFDQKPKVKVHGFPFLTQALSGRYDDVEVSGRGLRVGDFRDASLDARLRGVHLALGDVIGNKATALRVDSASGTVTLSYAEVARATGVAGLSLTDAGRSVQATAQVTVPTVGVVSVRATADVVVSGSTLHLLIKSVSAVGASVSSAALQPFVDSVQVPIQLPALPYGLTLTSITASGAGLVATGAARNVVITSAGA
jgi:hypothetical protein